MSVKKKKFEKKPAAERTKYHTGKMLKEEDLEEEQEYFTGKKTGEKKEKKSRKKIV